MKLIYVFLLTFFAFALQAQVNAAERAAKRAERKVTDKIVEKTFNGLVDKLFGSDSTKTTRDPNVQRDSSVTANSEPFGGLFSAKKVEKQYTFDLTLDVVITTKNKKGKGDPLDMQMHYHMDSAFMAVETDGVLSIMDFQEMKNYSIIGGNLTSMDLQKIIDKAEKMNDKEEEDDFTLKKTGKTETIAGYLCEEYVAESEEVTAQYWLTDKIGLKPENFMKSFATQPGVKYPKDVRGVVLKMYIEDKEDKTITTMETKEVIKQNLKYDLSKYKVTDLSRFGF